MNIRSLSIFVLCVGICVLSGCSKPEIKISSDRVNVSEVNPEANLTIQADINGKLFGIKKGELEIYKNNVVWGTREDVLASKTVKRKVTLAESDGNNIVIKAVLGVGKKSKKKTEESRTISIVGDGNNTLASADVINGGVTNYGYIAYPSDADYYKIYCPMPMVGGPSSIEITLFSIPGNVNYDVQLLNTIGTVMNESTNPGSADENISRSLPVGNYYIKVYTASGCSITDTYALKVVVP